MKTKHLLSYCTTVSTKHNCKSANTKIILTKKNLWYLNTLSK